MRNTENNSIQMCAYQPGMHSIGSKRRGIFIKTSKKYLLILLKLTSINNPLSQELVAMVPAFLIHAFLLIFYPASAFSCSVFPFVEF